MNDRYTIGWSGRNVETIEEIRRESKLRGRLREFYLAFDWMVEELKRTPGEIGESREYHRGSGLAYRVAFAGMLCMVFAIHEESRQVFIGRIRATF